jgi:D-glycero-alpha-D-manno-heptose 1-phosphate guanylyltransferase
LNHEVKALLLVGGLGTRLRSAVSSLPKAMASVGKRPFLELLVRQLGRQGIRHLVMCTGYLAEQIQNTFRDGSDFGTEIEYSRETVQLGTAGALKLAQRYVQDEPEFLVLNGDSFLDVDFGELIDFHRKHDSLATMTVVPVENASRYGTLQMGADGRVSKFVEKTGESKPGIINAGVYVFSSAVFRLIPEGPASLERDIIPRLVELGVYAVEQQGIFIDIGTPEDYVRAKGMADRLAEAAVAKHGVVPPDSLIDVSWA